MQINSPKFGSVPINYDEVILIRSGIHGGYEDDLRWILLADRFHTDLYWLQCVGRTHIALPVVDPNRFVSGYEFKAERRQLRALFFADDQPALVLAILSHDRQRLSLNLKMPVVINPQRRLGDQVVLGDDNSLQHVLPDQTAGLRKSA